jgi:uncharacterized protein YeaO (DUF488 family)
MAAKHEVRVRRAYDEPAPGDCAWVLVDRIWPPGAEQGEGRFRRMV